MLKASANINRSKRQCFYRMALRSASETGAILQIIRRLKIINDPSYQTFYEALTRVSKMLTKLIASMNSRASGRDRDGA